MASSVKSLIIVVTFTALCHGINIVPDPASQRLLQRYNKYYVFTRKDFRQPRVLEPNAKSAVASNLRTGSITFFLLHGQEAFAEPNVIMKETIIRRRNSSNVIIVDWSIIALAARKPQHLARDLGLELGELIRFLVDDHRPFIDRKTVHLIGLGAGCHIAGVAARYVRDTMGILGRITALDPVKVPDPAEKILRDDATYVEVIYTDAFGTGASAIGEPIGHVNFYPNGGKHSQPGCTTNRCSHERAWELLDVTLGIPGEHNLLGKRCANLEEAKANTCAGHTLRLGETSFPPANTYFGSIYAMETTDRYPFY